MQLKPDMLNGQRIYRGVDTDSSGVNHQNKFILHPPTTSTTHGPISTQAELVEQMLKQVITVSDETADPVVRGQALLFREKLKKAIAFWLKRSAINEREKCRLELVANGLRQASESIREFKQW